MKYLQKYTIFVLIFLIFFFLTCLVTYPLVFQLGSLTPGLGDQLLVSFTMNWNIYALFHDPWNLFNAPIFYPYHTTLAYSDTYITSSIISIIPLLIIKQPVVTYTSNLIISLTLFGFFTYLLTYYFSRDHFSSLIAGVLVAFCTFTLGKISVLQLVSIYFVPLALLFFFSYLDTQKLKYFIGFCIASLLQVYNSFLPGYFILFSIIPLLIIRRKDFVNLFLIPKAVLIGIITAILIIPTAIPFYSVSREFHYVRDIRDTIHFANRIRDTFYPPDATILQNDLISFFYAHDPNTFIYVGYIGCIFILGLILSSLYVFFKRKIISHTYIVWSIMVAVTGFILSLGPAFQWGDHIIKKPFIIPLPYVVFYYLIPGFKGMRNSGRWEMLFVFAAAIFIALCISSFLKTQKRWYKALFTILFLCGVIFEVNHPLHFDHVPAKQNFPKVYSYLGTTPRQEAVAEFPLFSWFMGEPFLYETMREYYNTAHFHPLVNGYSGFSPKEWEKRSVEYQLQFPDKKTISYLSSIHVTYLLLHKKEYDWLEKNTFKVNGKRFRTWIEIQNGLKDFPSIRLVKQFGDDYLYEIEGYHR